MHNAVHTYDNTKNEINSAVSNNLCLSKACTKLKVDGKELIAVAHTGPDLSFISEDTAKALKLQTITSEQLKINWFIKHLVKIKKKEYVFYEHDSLAYVN